MNLWLRILLLLLGTPFRARLDALLGVSKLNMRVWPNDLDTNLHMNNGRYLTIMDLGRFDLILRMGLMKEARKRKWIPVLSAANVRFRRELRLFQKFRLESRIVWWSGSHFVMEHRLVSAGADGREQLACIALMLGGIYERATRRFVPVAELVQTLHVEAPSPPATPEIEAFLAAELALKKVH
ncbi:MAG: thioesterase [Alphaproteobacteria bacterium]|nr:thioesterase [Alphaproteobacteria bacterium]